ncbi:MAG: hypothetical protein JNM75_05325 [Rhodospirillales bacterium]|nr:hypothetical protein [Rhodospirillales bacterium]
MYDETLALVLDFDRRKPAASLPLKLDALFRRLRAAADDPAGFTIEDEIWETWISHSDPELAAILNAVIAATASNEYERAESILSTLLARAPDYAEAWNKRATLDFLRRRDDDSVAAIARTLALEPRHFGAIAGFAQICLRNGDPTSARIAFEVALRINPRLVAVRIAVEELKRAQPITIH